MFYHTSKWGRAKKTVVDGLKYDSKFEAAYARELGLKLRAGEIEGFESHVRIPLEVNGYHICDYYVDFAVDHKDGTKELVETKGIATPVWVLKWKILEAMCSGNPTVKLTLVKQKKFNMRRIRPK